MSDTPPDTLAVLSGSTLFEMLSNQELQFVAALARPRQFAAGEALIEEGALGDSVFVIAAGDVEVMRGDAMGQQEAIASFGAGECVGEMSLIDKAYRSATVRAKSEVQALQLTAEDLTTFRNKHKDGFTLVVVNLARLLSVRLREANARLAARL